jgi:hypothetical protein
MENAVDKLRSITKESFASETDRQLAVAEARALIARIESPWETGFRQSWIEPSRMACLEITRELDLWTKWVSNGGAPKTLEEIAKLVTCDYDLLGGWLSPRLLFISSLVKTCHSMYNTNSTEKLLYKARVIWNLAGTHLLDVVQPGVFGLTAFTAALGDGPQIASTVALYFSSQGPAFSTLPSYVKEINFKNPTDHVNGAFAKWAKAPLWEWLKSNPEAEKIIGTVMQTYGANRPVLSQLYPIDRILSSTSGDGNIVLVDIGGSIGHDLLAFAKTQDFPPESLVLEDRPAVLENAGELVPAIKKLEYDFFTPQPIEGAAAYYL